jgi:hypothetical protein
LEFGIYNLPGIGSRTYRIPPDSKLETLQNIMIGFSFVFDLVLSEVNQALSAIQADPVSPLEADAVDMTAPLILQDHHAVAAHHGRSIQLEGHDGRMGSLPPLGGQQAFGQGDFPDILGDRV